MKYKSGFVNIIGRPNVGKSTLTNALLGERLSIITHKPQTTRHRILGILSEENFQIVFSDTPGLVYDPKYKMHRVMNRYVHSTIEDADVMLFITDPGEKYNEEDPIISILSKVEVPIILLINKIDIFTTDQVDQTIAWWKNIMNFNQIQPISALKENNTSKLLNDIIKLLPEGPAYYPTDQLSDKNERFFVAEMIREQILKLYSQEIPYSCEINVTTFKEEESKKGTLVRIFAEIYVARKTQKSIIIGKNGASIKQVGIESRKTIEAFLGKHVFLELYVKVQDNWRDDDRSLKSFGYN